MEESVGLERKQLLMLAGGGLGIAVAAFIITAFATGGIVSGSSGPDRIAFHYTDATSEQLPLTADLAAAAGWSGSILCALGKGRFYQKATADGPYPVMLMYGPEDDLVGIQIHSLTEQPGPLWEHQPDRGRGQHGGEHEIRALAPRPLHCQAGVVVPHKRLPPKT